MDLDIKNPEQIKQLIALLQNLLPEDNDQEHTESKIKTKTRSAKNRPKQKNKFLDMPEMKMHKDDSKIDEKLSVAPPTPRTRKFNPIDVKCRVCGKQEKVSPSVIPESVDRYKCNKCSGSAGG